MRIAKKGERGENRVMNHEMRFKETMKKLWCTVLGCLILGTLWGQNLEWEAIEAEGISLSELYLNQAFLGADEGEFYLSANNQANEMPLFYSEDGGMTWVKAVTGAGLAYGRDSKMGFIPLSEGEKLIYGVGSRILVHQTEEGFSTLELPVENGTASVRAGAASPDGTVVMVGARNSWQNDPAWWVSSDGGSNFTYFEGPDGQGGVDVYEFLSGIAYGNGVFVAVGWPGEAWTSSDGLEWQGHELPQHMSGDEGMTIRLHHIEFIEGHFWAVGDWLSIMRSENGMDWEIISSGPSGQPLTTLLVDGENWHAGGNTGGQAWSTDGGESWFAYYSRNDSYDPMVGGGGLIFADNYFAPAGASLGFFSRIELDFISGGFPKPAYSDGTWLLLYNEQLYRGAKPASFLDSATSADGIYYEHPWLGWFTKGDNGWIFHYNMGWIYSAAKNDNQVWIYRKGLGWIFTNKANWPYFYHANSGEYGIYTDGPDWFWNVNRGIWQERSDFGKDPWLVSQEWLIGKTITIEDSEGTHTLVVERLNEVTATFNTSSAKVFELTPDDDTTWFDSGFGAGIEENRRFTFDISDATSPGIGDRVILVLHFESAEGGHSLMTYSYLSGLNAVSKENIEGTFTVGE